MKESFKKIVWDNMKSCPTMTSTLIKNIKNGCVVIMEEHDGVMVPQAELDATKVVYGSVNASIPSNLYDVCNNCRVHSNLHDVNVDLETVKYEGVIKHGLHVEEMSNDFAEVEEVDSKTPIRCTGC